MIPLSAQVWGLRVLVMVALIALCAFAGSGFPALAFAMAWSPNGLFLYFFLRGSLRLPKVLVPVKPIEPTVYRWLGVGLVKRIVATRMWPLINGQEPPPKSKDRQELLNRTEQSTQGAEVCHAATFILASVLTVYYGMIGRVADAAWIFAFNILLNAYPVMLQRANRYRVQQVRASIR